MQQRESIQQRFEPILTAVVDAVRVVYGDRLVSLAVYGSVGRGTPRPDSDIDLLLVVDPLPDGRWARIREFDAVEQRIEDTLSAARDRGIRTRLSPVFKTPAELAARSPLLLDMTEDARILFDPQHTLEEELDAVRQRLEELGSRRIWIGSAWYWDLKPDFQPGDIVEI